VHRAGVPGAGVRSGDDLVSALVGVVLAYAVIGSYVYSALHEPEGDAEEEAAVSAAARLIAEESKKAQ
jgi:hypothetical protein